MQKRPKEVGRGNNDGTHRSSYISARERPAGSLGCLQYRSFTMVVELREELTLGCTMGSATIGVPEHTRRAFTAGLDNAFLTSFSCLSYATDDPAKVCLHGDTRPG